MKPFEPKRTFESVVQQLVVGLEDGNIVLHEEATSPPAKSEDLTGETARQALKIIERDAQGRKAIEPALKELSNRTNN
jgi:hypothetical protein